MAARADPPGPIPWDAPVGALLASLGTTESGLTSDEATRRLAEAGPNEPPTAKRTGAVVEALSVVTSPLMLVLLGAAATAGMLGEAADAGIIVVMVLLGAALQLVQTFRSRRAIERLREGLAPTAAVARDGTFAERPRREIVPGDVVRLVAGDLVPADARLLASRDLHVQEAALTGESLPVEKEASGAPAADPLEDPRVVLFGSSVVSGTAIAVVFATGASTSFGAIAATLARRAPETEFERGTRAFGSFIARTVAALVLFVVVAAAARGRTGLETLLFAIALAVGLTPEFLPMITAVTLSRGAVVMARRHVIVKSLAAIQNLGSVDVLCCDKTGTLTRGEMRLARSTDAFGREHPAPLALASRNSAHETGIRSPLDAAILAAARPQDREGWQKIDEIPFDFERRRLSIVVRRGDEIVLVAKGAPESILAGCTSVSDRDETIPLDGETRRRAEATLHELSDAGLRVLAVAFRRVAEQPGYTVRDERELVLAGFVAFADPPLEDTAGALAELLRDGVRVKVLTGDDPRVARHVATQIGLDPGEVVLGDEVAKTSDAALASLAERTTIFARVSPMAKLRILAALRSRRHVVGFVGDGINDAPSLHAADVGISVAGAVDVAREAAEVILLSPGLGVIHAGIVEGRRAFGNVVKYLLFGTSSSFGNMFSMAGAFLFLPFLPMLPTQILLNNFLYDLAQVTIPTDNVDPAFVRKPRRWDIGIIRRFMLACGPLSSVFDVLTFVALLRVFHADETTFHTGWFVESLATQTLVIFVLRGSGTRPSPWLASTATLVVALGVGLAWTPVAPALGLVPLPAAFLAFVAAAVVVYLGLVAMVRRRILGGAMG